MKYYGSLEAGGTKMVCAIGDEQGNILERVSIPTREPETTMPAIIDFFKNKGICALGIGCFGPIDLDKKSETYGYITTTPKLAWRNYDIVGACKKELGVPVGFDTDVNGSALGEATWGCTKELDNSIYITVGTGIGVGVIIDKKPYHGMIHPEGGHIFLARHPQDPMERGVCPYHGKPGVELADRKEVWELEAYYLAQAICSYIMILSPERIIVGGGVAHQEQMMPLIRAEVLRQMGGYITAKGMQDLDNYIVLPSLNDDQGILGALKLAMDAE